MPAKALRAAEWDRLDLLGDPREADRIVQEYAAFLEPNGSLAPARDAFEEAAPSPRPARGLFVLLLVVVAAPLIAALVYLLGGVNVDSADGEPPRGQATPAPAKPAPRASPPPAAPRRTTERKPPAPPAASPVRLILTAALGDSWVEARADSSVGPILFEGTLASGRTLNLSGRRLWARLGAASNLTFTLNGKRADPDLLGTVDVIVTPQGIEPT